MKRDIIIIGTGRLASSCVEACVEQGQNVYCIESESGHFSLLSALCRKKKVEYQLLTEKDALSKFFTSIKVPTLVVSAYNGYLFPEVVVENPNLDIVNFHNALLPKHRGRNAPTWAIFELDTVTGVTWHRVTKNIDDGDILIQRSIPISPLTTGLSLTLETLELGAALFKEILYTLVQGTYTHYPMVKLECGKINRGKDVPNDGILDVGWPIQKISAFLRSLDYKMYHVFPAPCVKLLDVCYKVSGYLLFHGCGYMETKLNMNGQLLSIEGNQLRIDIRLSGE